jgi:hypothetical protein
MWSLFNVKVGKANQQSNFIFCSLEFSKCLQYSSSSLLRLMYSPYRLRKDSRMFFEEYNTLYIYALNLF